MKKQSGMSMLGLMALLIAVGVVFKIGMAVGPMYFDNRLLQQVITTLHEKKTFDARSTPKAVHSVLSERIRSNNLAIPLDNLVVKRNASSMTMTLDYSVKAPLFANLYLVGQFSVNEEFK